MEISILEVSPINYLTALLMMMEKITFDTKLNITKNPLIINFLDYKKKKENSLEIFIKRYLQKK